MKHQLLDYNQDLGCVPILCDNTSAINLSKNPIQHSRTKHIEIRHHFLRDEVAKKSFELHFIETEKQIADIFTKPLPENRFSSLRRELGLCKCPSFWSLLKFGLSVMHCLRGSSLHFIILCFLKLYCSYLSHFQFYFPFYNKFSTSYCIETSWYIK